MRFFVLPILIASLLSLPAKATETQTLPVRQDILSELNQTPANFSLLQKIGGETLAKDQLVRRTKLWQVHQQNSPIVRSFLHSFKEQGQITEGQTVLSWVWHEAEQRKTVAADDHGNTPESRVTFIHLLSDAQDFIKTFDEYCYSFYTSRTQSLIQAAATESALAPGKRPFELRPYLVLHTNEQSVYELDQLLQADIMRFTAEIQAAAKPVQISTNTATN